MKKSLLIISILISMFSTAQIEEVHSKGELKQLMQDRSINFYEVVRAGEAFFNTKDKFAKGSGYKPFMRWVNSNEYKYAPDGNRSNVDPFFAENQYLSFIKNNPVNKALFNGSWKDLGPYTIDSITGHYSAGLGRIEDFYVDPNDSNKIYLGSRSGGFWRTTNGGSTWQGTTDFLMASGVNTLTASPTNSDSVLINVRNSRNGTSYGVFKSFDGGTTFSATNLHSSNYTFLGLGTDFEINEIAYHPRIANLVFVGSDQGLFRSTDNLQTFSRIQLSTNITEIAFHPTNDSIIYMYDSFGSSSNRDKVYRSVDLGNVFQRTGTAFGNSGNSSVEIATTPECPSCLYFASDNGIWISTDESMTYTFRGNSTQNCDGFAVSDIDSSIMAIGALDMDNSTDGGRTFVQTTEWALGNTNGNTSSNSSSYNTSSNYIHADVRNLKALNGAFYAATDGFLCKSLDNGVTWEILSEGVGTRENYKLGVSQSNHFRTMSGSQDNGTSILTEKGWVEFYGADGMEAIIHPLNADFMMGSVQYGTRRVTRNGGFSQTSATPNGSSGAYWEAPLAYDPNNQLTVFDFRTSLYKSDDFGTSHNSISNLGLGGDAYEAEIAQNNSNIIYVSRSDKLRKSVDGGLTFFDTKNNLPSYNIEDIAIDPNNDDVVIVVYGRYQADNQKVFITNNGGVTWSNITSNLGSLPIRSVVIDHTDSSNIYLGAEIGVYTKSMSASTWQLYNPGFPQTTAKELEINYGSNTLRTATWGRGLWEYSLVGRANYPAIMETSINNPPTPNSPKVGIDQFVTSKIHYNGNLSSVYVEWSQDSATFGNVISMTNTIDSTWESNTALPQFPVGTKVYFKVFAVGSSNDTTETYKFMYEVQSFDYCTATGNNGSGNLYIDNVAIENINNSTGNNAYTNYQFPILTLFTDSTYNLSLSANTSWSSNDFGAWIDFNGDADFDISERVLSSPNSGGGAMANFMVPSNAKVGDTVLMRVRVSYFSDAESCGNQFGEVEDYQVFLRNTTTSISNETMESEVVKVFPNPNNGSFKLSLPTDLAETTIQIYDGLGKIVEEKEIVNQQEVQFNLSLTKGVYFVRFEKQNKIITFVVGE